MLAFLILEDTHPKNIIIMKDKQKPTFFFTWSGLLTDLPFVLITFAFSCLECHSLSSWLLSLSVRHQEDKRRSKGKEIITTKEEKEWEANLRVWITVIERVYSWWCICNKERLNTEDEDRNVVIDCKNGARLTEEGMRCIIIKDQEKSNIKTSRHETGR